MNSMSFDDAALRTLGWDPELEEHFQQTGLEGLPARVVRQDRHLYGVLSAHEECVAEVSGRFRHGARQPADFPAVGDWVVVDLAPSTGAVIHAVLPRRSV